MTSDITIRELGAAEVDAFRAFRLHALETSPEAFGSSSEEEGAWPFEAWRARLSGENGSAVFGAFVGDRLVGTAAFARNARLKQRHKGLLWGVFVHADSRGRGIAQRLVSRVIDHAAEHVSMLQAAVVTSNTAARSMYHRLGFVPYGVERQALCVRGIFYDEELIALSLERDRKC